MNTGRLIAVAGPSGVGKDSVMQALARRRPGLHLVRRVITRPEDAGGEDFEGVTEAEFTRRVEAGAFALHWRAHGLAYGVPVGVRQVLGAGRDALVNLSRAVLPEAQARFDRFAVLSLTAAPSILADRLAARGRETRDDIARRLERAGFALPEGIDSVVTVDNGGALDDTVQTVIDRLHLDETMTKTTREVTQ